MEISEESSYKIAPHLGGALPECYQNMIYSKWLRSLRYGNDYFKLIESTAYYATYQKYIQAILHRPQTVVRLAVLSDDADVVLGFSVSEASVLHYCHTHKDNRNQGIASSLVPFEVKTITHLTKSGLMIWNSKLPNAIFNPFA